MSEWRKVALGELAALSNGANFTKASFGRGMKIVGVRDFGDRITPNWASVDEVDPAAVSSTTQYLQESDLVFVRSNGNPALVGRSMLITKGPLATHSAFTIKATPDRTRVDPRFLAYQLRHAHRSGRMTSANGTNITNLSQAVLRSVPVLLPEMHVQRRIASILVAFDDLIENARRRIALLEQLAQTIHREWFVHFRYPGHEDEVAAAARASDGWRLSKLGDELDVLESGTRPKGGIDPSERGVVSVGAENVLGLGNYRFDVEKHVSESFYESMRRGRVQDSDVLLYKDGAHIGRHSLFRDDFPHSRLAINEHVFRLRVRPPLTQSYLYFWIDRPETVEMIVALNSNAAQPGISQGKLVGVPIHVPPEELVARWEQIVEPKLALLFALAKQEHVLRTTRDLLLPKLVTGAIDVSQLDADALFDETAA